MKTTIETVACDVCESPSSVHPCDFCGKDVCLSHWSYVIGATGYICQNCESKPELNPMLRLARGLSVKLLHEMIEVAKEGGVPWQARS
mgnify:CR=1 FL=1